MQMTTGQQPNQISDYDLLTELNACFKQKASSLTHGILETSNPGLRQRFQAALQTCFQQHHQLSQFMVQKGYYKPLPSSPQMVGTLKEQIATANAQIGGPLPPGMTQPVQPNMTAPVTGTGPISPQGGFSTRA